MSRKRELSLKGKANTKPDPGEARRMVRLLVIYSVTALIAAYSIVFWMKAPHTMTWEERGVLTAYEPVRAALASDDLSAAKAAAEKMAKNFADRAPTVEPARKISDSVTLHDAREAFKDLSADAVNIARGQHGYFIIHCPISGCPEPCEDCPMDRFGPWVQISPNVENPFTGRVHGGCGLVMR